MGLSTVNEKNQAHRSVIVYQSNGQIIYVQIGSTTIKVKDILRNNKISVTIPFWKNFLHKIIPAPSAELHFTATAEIVLKENEEARQILRKFIKHAEKVQSNDETIGIKIAPSKKIFTYGVGIPIWTMRKPEEARNIIHLD